MFYNMIGVNNIQRRLNESSQKFKPLGTKLNNRVYYLYLLILEWLRSSRPYRGLVRIYCIRHYKVPSRISY